jgi:hypothetical protein
MRTIARVNKHVTNPVQKLWAPRLRHMAVIEHAGRKSGKSYQTPVMAFVEDGALSVVLNYGPQSDWVQCSVSWLCRGCVSRQALQADCPTRSSH